MNKEEALKHKCGVRGCDQEAVLTTRLDTDEGPTFDCFCKGHLRVAADYINMLAETLGRTNGH